MSEMPLERLTDFFGVTPDFMLEVVALGAGSEDNSGVARGVLSYLLEHGRVPANMNQVCGAAIIKTVRLRAEELEIHPELVEGNIYSALSNMWRRPHYFNLLLLDD